MITVLTPYCRNRFPAQRLPRHTGCWAVCSPRSHSQRTVLCGSWHVMRVILELSRSAPEGDSEQLLAAGPVHERSGHDSHQHIHDLHAHARQRCIRDARLRVVIRQSCCGRELSHPWPTALCCSPPQGTAMASSDVVLLFLYLVFLLASEICRDLTQSCHGG